MSTQFLNDQLEKQVEAWKGPHLEALQCYEFEDQIAHCLWIFDRISERYHSERKRSVDSELTMVRLYKLWGTLASSLIVQSTGEPFPGFEIKGLEPLSKAFEKVAATKQDLDRIESTLENVKQGKNLLTLQQAVDELRNRCQGGRI